MWIWVDVFSAGIEPGNFRIAKFLKCRALHHWAMVTDESPKILWDPLSRVRKTETFIVFYLFVLCLKTWYFTAIFMSQWTSISVSTSILHVMPSRFCLYVLIFITLITHYHMHIQRQTHTSTNVWSTPKRNGDNQVQEPGWEERKKGLAHRYLKSGEKRFEQIELPATRLFVME